jgi:hypothetical protein
LSEKLKSSINSCPNAIKFLLSLLGSITLRISIKEDLLKKNKTLMKGAVQKITINFQEFLVSLVESNKLKDKNSVTGAYI